MFSFHEQTFQLKVWLNDLPKEIDCKFRRFVPFFKNYSSSRENDIEKWASVGQSEIARDFSVSKRFVGWIIGHFNNSALLNINIVFEIERMKLPISYTWTKCIDHESREQGNLNNTKWVAIRIMSSSLWITSIFSLAKRYKQLGFFVSTAKMCTYFLRNMDSINTEISN